MRGRKILIRTLNVYNGNYGGVLQAYALQRVVDSLGHEAWTDSSSRGQRFGRPRQVLRSWRRGALPARRRPIHLASEVINAHLDAFVRENLRLVDLYKGRRWPRAVDVDEFEGFVVGSDQIWRTDYGDVPSYLLDFVGDRRAPRVAYAASFGVDRLDPDSASLLRQYRSLAAGLSSLSVREDSAVALCRDLWGVPAVHVLDPTMLLNAEHYRSLHMQADPSPIREPHLYHYLLDPTPAKQVVVSRLAGSLGLAVRSILPPTPPSYLDAIRTPAAYRKPSVPDWLRGFAEADFVVTDSFHGAALSIMYERPFVVIDNRSRGSARMRSLLDSMSLLDHLVSEDETDETDVRDLNPDWGVVRQALDEKRTDSFAFLRSALA